MLTPYPPSTKASSTMFFPICTLMIAIWLSITIDVIAIFGTTNGTIFSMNVLVTFCGLSTIDIFLTQEPFPIIVPTSKYNWFSTFVYCYPEISLLPKLAYFGKLHIPKVFEVL
jgi:hypothetical protein